MAKREYVIHVGNGVEICEIKCPDGVSQIEFARRLAKEAGRAAVLSGESQFFWADVEDGKLIVGAFEEELVEE